MQISAGTIFVGCGVILMFAASHPAPLRKGRWLKMLISLPVLGVAGWLFDQGSPASVQPLVGCVIAFSLLWLNNFTWFAAEAVHRVVHGRPNQGGGGFVPDYRGTRSRVEDGDLEQAIEYVQFELSKEPGNFEGRWLLAAIYQEQRKFKEAAEQLDLILACPTSTPAQIASARAALQQVRAQQIQLDSTRERK
ncbi:MAG: tetratricopeptide repeat protein [Verrucomicrobia bacterium]|nr:tetratricopeptide repeat protein [Verrucomicrobiota bacterium]NBU08712.1 tetratricopeptide repeat protein [Pseudomonadota bacterium]NDA67396.1 tetratricopeptide repeat protein [Verrucomicrobiota bacterium]NDD39263.1 tetratricopeptide repeat protein [Verrucomicrobiota bacterium]NDE99198.1 tetratricopeptide repeat protein [Verrucomicrobiota bacterium]